MYQPVVELYAVPDVVQQFPFGGLPGGSVVFDDFYGVFDVGGQYLKFGNHLGNEKRERTHGTSDDGLDDHNDRVLDRERKRVNFDLKTYYII